MWLFCSMGICLQMTGKLAIQRWMAQVLLSIIFFIAVHIHFTCAANFQLIDFRPINRKVRLTFSKLLSFEDSPFLFKFDSDKAVFMMIRWRCTHTIALQAKKTTSFLTIMYSQTFGGIIHNSKKPIPYIFCVLYIQYWTVNSFIVETLKFALSHSHSHSYAHCDVSIWWIAVPCCRLYTCYWWLPLNR